MSNNNDNKDYREKWLLYPVIITGCGAVSYGLYWFTLLFFTIPLLQPWMILALFALVLIVTDIFQIKNLYNSWHNDEINIKKNFMDFLTEGNCHSVILFFLQLIVKTIALCGLILGFVGYLLTGFFDICEKMNKTESIAGKFGLGILAFLSIIPTIITSSLIFIYKKCTNAPEVKSVSDGCKSIVKKTPEKCKNFMSSCQSTLFSCGERRAKVEDIQIVNHFKI